MKTSSSKQLPISVVICTRNRGEILGDCISSLIESDFPTEQYELVVVDDGSTDDTAAVVKAFQTGTNSSKGEKNPVNIHYRPMAHGGVNAARNAGIKNCSGEVVLFIDDDEEVPPDYLKRLWKSFTANPEASGIGGPLKERSGTKLGTCNGCASLADASMGKKKDHVKCLIGGNMALRAESFHKVGLFDPEISGLGDEGEWFRRAAGLSFLYDPDLWVWHRRDNLSLLGLCRHSFVQGLALPLVREKVGKKYHPNLMRILRLLAHALSRKCAQGLVLAMNELGACAQYLRLKATGRYPRN
jgi:glycosyltransferase involved in cell wall biosynthesis